MKMSNKINLMGTAITESLNAVTNNKKIIIADIASKINNPVIKKGKGF